MNQLFHKRICILLIITFVLPACKTYEKSIIVNSWIDKWNYKYRVFEVKKYYKKNDSLISMRYDTLKIDLNMIHDASENKK